MKTRMRLREPIGGGVCRVERNGKNAKSCGKGEVLPLDRSLLTLQRHLTHGLSYMPLRDVVIAHFSRPPWGPILPVGVPTTHMPAPWTPGRSLGAGKVLDTARIRSPWRSSEVRHPRVLTSRGLCITPVAP